MRFVVEHLEKSFGKKQVINDASFEFEEGKIYGLLGRNGAGKTTFFNCINKDIKSDAGSFYFVENESVHEAKPNDIGYVLSTPNVPEFLTAREFLKFFLEINPHLEADIANANANANERQVRDGVDTQKLSGADILNAHESDEVSVTAFTHHADPDTSNAHENTGLTHASQAVYQNLQSTKIDRLFDIVKLARDDRDKLLKDYSHGMKNKVQMLIALISEPKLLLLDEPLTSLDVVVSEEMKQLLRKHKDGRITIFSTHILDLAVDLCDEIVLLSGGKLQRVDHAQLSNSDFKAQIIKALQEEDESPREEIPQVDSIKDEIPKEEVSQIREGTEDAVEVAGETTTDA